MSDRKKSIQQMHRLTPEQFTLTRKLPLTVVLDNVRSRHNVGAVFRTADAFAIDGLHLCGITCCPPDTELHKTALGAELTVPYTYYPHTTDAIRLLKERGMKVYAVEIAHDALTLEQAFALPHNQGVALVLGHEVFGVSEEVIALCDGCIELPQYGTKHSLNVSVTAGIVIYEWAEHLRNQMLNSQTTNDK